MVILLQYDSYWPSTCPLVILEILLIVSGSSLLYSTGPSTRSPRLCRSSENRSTLFNDGKSKLPAGFDEVPVVCEGLAAANNLHND